MYAYVFAFSRTVKTILYISAAHQHHQTLHFTPLPYNAVCCDDRYIYIIQYKPPMMSIYNWAGQHLCDFDHNQLGLSSENELLAAGVVGDSLVLAVSYRNGFVNSLQQYDIK